MLKQAARWGPSTPRPSACVTRSICEALRSEAVTFLISLVVRGQKAPESIYPTSIAGVLRLRAINSLNAIDLRGASLRMTLFWRGLKNIWSDPRNTGRSKKSQALRMTPFWRVEKDLAASKKHKNIEKVTGSQDDAFVGVLNKNIHRERKGKRANLDKSGICPCGTELAGSHADSEGRSLQKCFRRLFIP